MHIFNIAQRFYFPLSELKAMDKYELEYWSELADEINKAEAKAANG